MEHSIRIDGETVYHPLHEQLYPVWEALVTAREIFGDAPEVIAMKESYIAMRKQTEGVLHEDRSWDWQEDYEQEQRDAQSA